MAFTVTKTDGSTLAIITGNAVNTTAADIALHGQGKLLWGNPINENFVHMLENFAFGTAPLTPIVGQLWFDTTTMGIGSPVGEGVLKFWSESGSPITGQWIPLTTATSGSTNFVNVIGDTMTGDLTLSSANLTVTGSGPTALTVSGGDVDITGTLTVNTGGSPLTTAADLTGDVIVHSSQMTFTDITDTADVLTFNKGSGDASVGPDIEMVGDGIMSAGNTLHLSFNSNLGGGFFKILSEGETSGATERFRIDNAGNVFTSGTTLQIHNQSITAPSDATCFIDLESAVAHADYSTRIQRSSGTDGEFHIINRGTGTLNFWHNSSRHLIISGTTTDIRTNRLINLALGTGAADGIRHDQTIGNLGVWTNVLGSRSFSTTYTNTLNRPIAVSVVVNFSFASGQAELFIGAVTANLRVGNFFIDEESSNNHTLFGIVPPGHRYRVTKSGSGSGVPNTWHELR